MIAILIGAFAGCPNEVNLNDIAPLINGPNGNEREFLPLPHSSWN